MSSDQAPVSSFEDATPEPTPEPRWTPTRDDVCHGCGGHVTEQYRKVLGDNDDRVHACPQCENKHGSERKAAGVPTIGGGER